MVHSLASISDTDIDDSMYCNFFGIISHLGGVYGERKLTEQHLVHVGAYVGILPTKILSVAAISSSTNAFQHLVEVYDYLHKIRGKGPYVVGCNQSYTQY